MYRYQISCPFFVKKFEKHIEIKEKLLSLIDEQQATTVNESDLSERISRTDWKIDSNEQRPYWSFLQPNLAEHVQEIYKTLEYTEIQFGNHWFQQYYTTDMHGWHRHANCSWANVYYIELSPDAPATHLKDPITGDIYHVDAKEGDILTFPSFILHCSPPNESQNRKTVVAFNIQ